MFSLQLGFGGGREKHQICVREKTRCLSASGPEAILPIAEELCLWGVKAKTQKHHSALPQMGTCFASFFCY